MQDIRSGWRLWVALMLTYLLLVGLAFNALTIWTAWNWETA
jgi:hypothetical protein